MISTYISQHTFFGVTHLNPVSPKNTWNQLKEQESSRTQKSRGGQPRVDLDGKSKLLVHILVFTRSKNKVEQSQPGHLSIYIEHLLQKVGVGKHVRAFVIYK